MNILYDENIPYAQQFFCDLGTLIPFAGRTLTSEQAANADALLVRSITKVNEQLLSANDKLKFVGTATIGFDHVDKQYLQTRDIPFTNAPGCNAISVAEYVISALMVMSERLAFSPRDKLVGIVGAGNTGSALAKKLDALGVRYQLCDPILQASGDPREFVSLDEISQCDVISLHVPKITCRPYPTVHLFDQQRLAQLDEQQILINACRGEVIDNKALLALKTQGQGPHLVMDVWENEPNILTELMPYCQITTPHIAGYSLEGKARGTEMLYQALSKVLGNDANKTLSDFLPEAALSADVDQQISIEAQIKQAVFNVYDVRRDDHIMRQQLAKSGFDYLRKNYPVRREFSALELSDELHHSSSQFKRLGFA